MIKVIALVLVFVLFLAWAFGVRFHPDAAMDFLKGYSGKKFCKIELKSGASFIGEILRESPEAVKIQFDGGTSSFPKEEIRAMTSVDAKDLHAQSTQGPIVLSTRKPVLSYHPEKGMISKLFLKKKKKVLPPGQQLPEALKEAVQAVDSNAAPVMRDLMQTALEAKAKAERTKIMAIESLREAEGG